MLDAKCNVFMPFHSLDGRIKQKKIRCLIFISNWHLLMLSLQSGFLDELQ